MLEVGGQLIDRAETGTAFDQYVPLFARRFPTNSTAFYYFLAGATKALDSVGRLVEAGQFVYQRTSRVNYDIVCNDTESTISLD